MTVIRAKAFLIWASIHSHQAGNAVSHSNDDQPCGRNKRPDGRFSHPKYLDDDDYGHYSIIANIGKAKDELIIVDPYKDFVHQNRIVKISVFLKRWWDYNEVKDPYARKKLFKKDKQLFFVVAPLNVTFPSELQM